MSPHDPYLINPCMSNVISGRRVVGPTNDGRTGYSALCEIIDVWVGRLISYLESEDTYRGTIQTSLRRSTWNSTLVIYSSDHGDVLGDDGVWGKQVPHQQSIAVPLIIRPPNFLKLPKDPISKRNRAATFMRDVNVQQPVSLVDLSATVR